MPTSRSVQDTLLRTAVIYDWTAGAPATAERVPAERPFLRPRARRLRRSQTDPSDDLLAEVIHAG